MKINSKKNNTQSTFNWHVLFVLSLTSIITGIYREGFASLFPFLQKEFHLTNAQLGLHSTLFYFTNAFVSIYAGRLVDLKGSKWGLVFSGLLMSILYFSHSVIPNFLMILFMAALTGVVVSFNMPSVNKGVVGWFPRKQRSTALGLQSMAFPIGGLLGAIALPFFGNIFGWRKTMFLPSVIAILGVLFISYYYQEKGKVNNYLLGSEKLSISFWKSISQLIKNRELIKISLFGLFLGMMANSICAHFTLFLFLDYDLPEIVAGLGFAFVQLGSIVGRAAWGILCDRVLEGNKRKTFLFMGLSFWFTTIIFNIGLRYLNPSVSILFLLAFLAGCFGNGWPGIFSAAVAETVKEENVGVATGIAFLLVRSGLMIAPPIFGYIADIKGSYSLSWFLLGIIVLIASLGQFLLSEKRVETG
jgi:ACS family hexuronate transporter-like MFS transporter